MTYGEMKMRWILWLILAAVALSGCHTVEGIGKDLRQGGEAIERAGARK
jgi:predicted small secreted protein